MARMIGLGHRIRLAADRVGGLNHLATLLTDVSRRTLTEWANDKTEPRASSLSEIASITDVSLNWLINGGTSALDVTGEQARKEGAASTAAAFIRLPAFGGVLAAAGMSSIPADELANGVMSFDPRFLRDQGAVPEKCSVIWAKGDSMTPTIPDGSALIVDQSQTEIANGCIMVIGVEDDLLVKRIRRRLDGLIELISDNAAYAPETLGPAALQQLRVIGRVVYFCRTP
jgi:phage repressor protein C with HTH and peptisase S24 domain